MASEPLTLAQLAAAAGMSAADAELYQERGLLQPPRRSTGRHQRVGYHQEHLDRLHLIRRALVYGFSLDAIQRIVSTSGLVTCRDVMNIADVELQRLRDLLGADAPAVAALAQLRDRCPGTGGREDCQIYAALTGVDGR